MWQHDSLLWSRRSTREHDESDILWLDVQLAKRRQRRQVVVCRRWTVETDAPRSTVGADHEDLLNMCFKKIKSFKIFFTFLPLCYHAYAWNSFLTKPIFNNNILLLFYFVQLLYILTKKLTIKQTKLGWRDPTRCLTVAIVRHTDKSMPFLR